MPVKPSTPRAIVLGAGIAGLVAARELSRMGVPCTVFEASDRVAGLASSERDAEGFAYDVGAHFITNRLAGAVGVGAACRRVAQYGEIVVVNDKLRGYPYGLMATPRYALSAAASRLASRSNEPITAREWFQSMYGRALADEIAIPLVEAWSGASADELAASVGGNIPSSIMHTLFLRAASRVTHRAVSLGYSHEAPESAGVFHVYPEAGVATICHSLVESLDQPVQLSTPVQEIVVEDGAVRGVIAGDELHHAELIVSTAPVNVLPRLAPGCAALDRFAAFRYRPMVFVNLRFAGRGLLRDTVVWTPEEQFPFFRLTESPLSMPLQAPRGKTIITADIGCEVGDEIWTMDDDALGARCLDGIAQLAPRARDAYLGCRVVRTKLAYPVYLTAYEDDRRRLEAEGTGVDGLLSIGRNGEFAHILMEDVYWRTLRRIHDWADQRKAVA